jgi:hypothetical protein
MTDLLINQMPARKVTKLINESNIIISRCEREEANGYGPAGEVYWVVYDEDELMLNRNTSDPYYRLWEARECALHMAMAK